SADSVCGAAPGARAFAGAGFACGRGQGRKTGGDRGGGRGWKNAADGVAEGKSGRTRAFARSYRCVYAGIDRWAAWFAGSSGEYVCDARVESAGCVFARV